MKYGGMCVSGQKAVEIGNGIIMRLCGSDISPKANRGIFFFSQS